MVKSLSELSASDRRLLKQTASGLRDGLKAFGGTQEQYAKHLGETRSTISHIINCVEPATKNPVFKSRTIITRVFNKVEDERVKRSIVAETQAFIRAEVKREVKKELERIMRKALTDAEIY